MAYLQLEEPLSSEVNLYRNSREEPSSDTLQMSVWQEDTEEKAAHPGLCQKLNAEEQQSGHLPPVKGGHRLETQQPQRAS